MRWTCEFSGDISSENLGVLHCLRMFLHRFVSFFFLFFSPFSSRKKYTFWTLNVQNTVENIFVYFVIFFISLMKVSSSRFTKRGNMTEHCFIFSDAFIYSRIIFFPLFQDKGAFNGAKGKEIVLEPEKLGKSVDKGSFFLFCFSRFRSVSIFNCTCCFLSNRMRFSAFFGALKTARTLRVNRFVEFFRLFRVLCERDEKIFLYRDFFQFETGAKQSKKRTFRYKFNARKIALHWIALRALPENRFTVKDN